jgi:hypothetical protein
MRCPEHSLAPVPIPPLRFPLLTSSAILVLWAAAPTTSRAITHEAMVFHNGVVAGLQLASAFVDRNAPDWTSDYTLKSTAEFQLVAMESGFTLGTLGQIGAGAGYAAGVAAGIQDYIDLMNSVGDPVWFTDPSDPTDSATSPGSLSSRLSPRARPAAEASSGRPPL